MGVADWLGRSLVIRVRGGARGRGSLDWGGFLLDDLWREFLVFCSAAHDVEEVEEVAVEVFYAICSVARSSGE